ncbi:MAG TPA: ATP-binding cassette domain-containing protein [Candidatus Limiplasma sp.]|nr:ATP-binding cassette domain-containing protein [Candidatus Limiplasma sp.]HPS80410.1 ATP-binding cassette domain-containing protein [Candidatus Limiplasma sp.]
MLELQHLSKTFAKGTVNEHTALDGIDFTLNNGDFVTILGSNGAGKSTLFNAITGAFWPDHGSVLLDGENITYLPEYKRAQKIGILFQDPMKGTAPDMTIAENLALAYTRGRRFPLARALQKRDVDDLRDRLAAFGMGLENRMKMKVGLLSGGQRQAMTLLMATVARPKLLLLDEHTAALDPATAEKVLAITLTIVREQHLPTMMITHNMQSALAMGNRTLMMEAGKIILDISGEERAHLQVEDLLHLYSGKQGKMLDNDRMLLSQP